MDLVEFLTARLDEDERIARAAATLRGGGEWAAEPDPEGVIAVTGLPEAWQSFVPVVVNPDDDETAVHIARHDPARVLVEVDAKRRIVAAFIEASNVDERRNPSAYDYGVAAALGAAVDFLALPYADHPDYDEAWRP